MATKKISELPLISAISGSVGYGTMDYRSVVPVVVGGTTNQILIEDFGKFVTAYSATTASNTFIGNQTITGSLVVTGDVKAERYYIETITSSVIYESGSTLFGNTVDDVMTVTGTILLNGTAIGTGQLNSQTSSQDLVNVAISSITGSINKTTSSFDSVFLRISSITGSMNVQSSSQDLVNFRNSTVTASINFATASLNTQTGSQGNLNAQIGIATSSLNFTTSSLNAFTGSIIGQTNTIATLTSSLNFTTQSLNRQTGSQNSLNTSVGLITASIYSEITSFNNVFGGVSNVTGAFATELGSIKKHILTQATQTASQDIVNFNISKQTGSQDLVNYQNSIVTSSFRNEIGGIEAYTASLKNAIIVNGTNVQIVGELDVARLNVQYVSSSVSYNSGSNIFGDASADKHEFTGSVNIADTLFIKGQAIGLGELNTQTGSQDLVNRRISSTTGSINTTTASFDSVFLRISSTTGSMNTQTGSQDLVNLSISTFTGSLRTELNNIEALTASMKAAAIVSSSQQITNYFTFAKTGSANTFYGTQTISGSVLVSGSLIPSVGIGQYTSSFSLGSNTNSWKDIWVASTGNINFLNNSGVVESTLSSTVNGLSALSLLVGTSSYAGAAREQMYVGQGRTNNPNNTAIGVGVLKSVTPNESTGYGTFNTGIGTGVMQALTLGMQNTAIGHNALYQNGQSIGLGDGNVAIGYYAGAQLYDAGSNVFVGYYAGGNVTQGSANTAIGNNALKSNSNTNSSFTNNIAIGNGAGQYLSGSSNNNIAIGNGAGPQSIYSQQNYKLYIGNGATPLLTGSIDPSNLSLTIKGALTVDANSPTAIHQITGSLNVTGSIFISGSVYANTTSQSVASNTASLDFTAANFFMVQLGSNVTTHISASNLRAGQSVNVLVTTGTNSTASFSTNVRQPSGSFYLPTSGSGNKDVLSFVSFDSSNLYLVAVNQMI